MSSIYRKKEEIVTRRIAEETLLVPIRSNLAEMQRIYGLNPVAEYIWQQLDGKRNLADVYDGVVINFDVKKEQAKSDIQEFILQLLESDMIESAAIPGDCSPGSKETGDVNEMEG